MAKDAASTAAEGIATASIALLNTLRDREKDLLAQKASAWQQWTAAHPDLPALAEKVRQLSDEIEHLHALLREHGIEPEPGAA